MSRCTSEVVFSGVEGGFKDETLRLYLEMFSSPKRSNTVFRQEGDINFIVLDLHKTLSDRRMIREKRMNVIS